MRAELNVRQARLDVGGWAHGLDGGEIVVTYGPHETRTRLEPAKEGDLDRLRSWHAVLDIDPAKGDGATVLTATLGTATARTDTLSILPEIIVSKAEVVGSNINIVGWCTGRQAGDKIDVLSAGQKIGTARPIQRLDVQENFPLLPDTQPGFSVTAPYPDALSDGSVWLDVELRRNKTLLASCSVMARLKNTERPRKKALAALLNRAPPEGAQRALARSLTPRGRRRLLASRAFHEIWANRPDSAGYMLRSEIVRAMIECGEITGPLDIRLKSGHLIEADPVSDAVIARKFLLDGTYENGLIERLHKHVKPGHRVFDIGSCYGHIALACTKMVGAIGQVVAVEPNPVMARKLRSAICRNSVSQLQLVESALGDKPGEVVLRVAAENIGGSRLGIAGVSETDAEFGAILGDLNVVSLDPGDLGNAVKPQEDRPAPQSHKVQMRTLDDLTEQYGCPNLVKIDIEGAELLCLKGGSRLLAGEFGQPPIITMEYSSLFPTFGGKRDDAFNLLISAGYRAFRMGGGKVRGGKLIPVITSDAAPEHDDLFFLPDGRTAD